MTTFEDALTGLSHQPYCVKLKAMLRSKRLQDAQLSQRDRAAGCVIVFAKSRKTGTMEDNILQTL